MRRPIPLVLSLTLTTPLTNSTAAQAAPSPARRTVENMRPLNALVGSWHVSGRVRWGITGEWSTIDAEPVIIESLLKGRYVQMRVRIRQGAGELGTNLMWSYDTFQSRYRMAALDDQIGMLDTFVGHGPNPIVVDNLHANTFFAGSVDGRAIKALARMTLTLKDSANFTLQQETTTDSGKTWIPFLDAVARRVK